MNWTVDRGQWWKDICVANDKLSLMVRAVHFQKDKVPYAAVSNARLHHVTKSQDAILEQLYRLMLH
jgi:uncharacterized protein (DUF2461 family)